MNYNWNPRPRSAYSITMTHGAKVGFGHLPIWDVVPGAWNILTLSSPIIQELELPWTKSPRDFPSPIMAIALSVALALQFDHRKPAYVGQLAESSRTPTEFLDAIEGLDGLIPDLAMKNWWPYMRIRAKVLEESMFQTKLAEHSAEIFDFKTGEIIQ